MSISEAEQCKASFDERYKITCGIQWARSMPAQICFQCGLRQRIYCGNCGVNLLYPPTSADPRKLLIDKIDSALPKGLTVHSVIHPSIQQSNCTSIHMKLLTKENRMHIHRLPTKIPTFSEKTAILFPSSDALQVSEFPELENLIVIESSWGDAAEEILAMPEFQNLPKVILSDQPVKLYWKSVNIDGDSMMSTIEAIRVALCEMKLKEDSNADITALDELLFFLRIEAMRRARAIDQRRKANGIKFEYKTQKEY